MLIVDGKFRLILKRINASHFDYVMVWYSALDIESASISRFFKHHLTQLKPRKLEWLDLDLQVLEQSS